jgi:hypothetical protein
MSLFGYKQCEKWQCRKFTKWNNPIAFGVNRRVQHRCLECYKEALQLKPLKIGEYTAFVKLHEWYKLKEEIDDLIFLARMLSYDVSIYETGDYVYVLYITIYIGKDHRLDLEVDADNIICGVEYHAKDYWKRHGDNLVETIKELKNLL